MRRRKEKEKGRGRGSAEGERGKEARGCYRIAFWNVIGRKMRTSGEGGGLRRGSYVGDMAGGKGMGETERKAAEGYKWEMQPTKKRNKKGKTMGGMVMGVRKKIEMAEGEETRRKRS